MATDLSLFGSYWQTGDFDDTFGGGTRLGFGDGPVQFELRASYFPDIAEDFEQLFDSDSEFEDQFEITAIPVEAGVTFNFAGNESFSPYIGGGASYILLDTDIGEVDDEVGFYVVAGFKAGGNDGGVGFVAEAIYRNIEGQVNFDPEDFDDVDDVDFDDDFDLDLAGVGANVGIVFRF
ncbi:MAG TPA: outer membrane beta-barrel protein [Thermoanaerobaculia bacterium]|nr:outer membrane beta-barrel protein [Thermoanaerobaculia bacterium]